jgi:methylase of polypeptide subunit release factors
VGSAAGSVRQADESYAEPRRRVRELLGDDAAWAQARRTTLNAHYNSAEVLEPGCGSGNFIGLAPPGARVTGVELDATTAAVARHLYARRATIHTGRFEDLAEPEGHFDLVIGNVPFAKVTPYDRRHNQGRHATGGSGISELRECPAIQSQHTLYAWVGGVRGRS